MDEGGVWLKFPVRKRGLYREFHESMVLYYQTLDKAPFVTYYSWPDQLEGGYEPKAARAVLYGFIHAARQRGGVLDVSLRTRVSAVAKRGDTVTGVTLSYADGSQQNLGSKVLIDATEIGAVPAAMLRLSGNIALKPLTVSSGVYRLMWDVSKSDIGG